VDSTSELRRFNRRSGATNRAEVTVPEASL